MKEVKVIIAANFGDEGKGLMTDYFCNKCDNPIVVRFNSGAQAGHTVVTPDGNRHVFGHFGSGTFNNTPTFLSKYFVVNPLSFLKELNELMKIGLNPQIYVDDECLITTPYDMIINQIVEIFRGKNNHGSCGLGFNETLVRNSKDRFKLKVKDILDINLNKTKVYEILMDIKNHYVNKRLKELGVNNIDNEFKSILENNNLIFNFIEDIQDFIKDIKITSFKEINRKFTTLIFEGAQGLMLHENYKYFPHVTHSKTGIENVIELLNEVYSEFSNEAKNKVNIEVIYVTRSYLTRHGAGPLPGELNCAPYNKIVDLTNIPNRFQGCLRFALLDLDLLNENIYNDFNKVINSGYNIRKSLAITCLDQIDNFAKYIFDNSLKESNLNTFINNVINKIKPYRYYLSKGASRATIEMVEN